MRERGVQPSARQVATPGCGVLVEPGGGEGGDHQARLTAPPPRRHSPQVFWCLTIIVLIKYVCFALRADDNGEGGTFALYAVICRACNLRGGGTVHTSDLELSGYQTAEPGQEAGAAPEIKKKPPLAAKLRSASANLVGGWRGLLCEGWGKQEGGGSPGHAM